METPRNVVKKVSGRVRVCFFPSSLLKVVRCARLAGAQRSRAARPQRGSVNVRTPEEHRRSRVRVWRHCPPEGFRLKFQRPCDSARDDPARRSVPLLASTGAYLTISAPFDLKLFPDSVQAFKQLKHGPVDVLVALTHRLQAFQNLSLVFLELRQTA